MRFDSVFCTNSHLHAEPRRDPHRHLQPRERCDHARHAVGQRACGRSRRRCRRPAMRPALFGKWHLGHGPAHDPTGLRRMADPSRPRPLPRPGDAAARTAPSSSAAGYVTDLITDDCLDFLDRVDGPPVRAVCHHKAAHRTWEPGREHFTMYDDVDIPEPDDVPRRPRRTGGGHPGRADADDGPRPDPRPQGAASRTGCRRTTRSAGATSGTSRTTCGSWHRSTTTSAACSTTSTITACPTARSWSTRRIRASSSATTAGSTSG